MDSFSPSSMAHTSSIVHLGAALPWSPRFHAVLAAGAALEGGDFESSGEAEDAAATWDELALEVASSDLRLSTSTRSSSAMPSKNAQWEEAV